MSDIIEAVYSVDVARFAIDVMAEEIGRLADLVGRLESNAIGHHRYRAHIRRLELKRDAWEALLLAMLQGADA